MNPVRDNNPMKSKNMFNNSPKKSSTAQAVIHVPLEAGRPEVPVALASRQGPASNGTASNGMKIIFLKNKAFVLIELIVALGIFSIIMAITTGGFINFLKTQRQTSSFAFVNNTLSVVLEQMTKEIRTGKNFSVDGVPCQPQSAISFDNAKGKHVIYYLESGTVKRGESATVILTDCSLGQAITGSKVSVGYLKFIVLNNQSGSGYPPRITVLVGANPNNEYASIYSVNLQTTVSSRKLGG